MSEDLMQAAQSAFGGRVISDEDFFSEANKSQGGFFKFATIGDKIKGTYVGKRAIPKKGIYPEQIGYELKTANGIVTCAFGLNKINVHQSLKFAKFGQVIGFRYSGDFQTAESKKDPNISPAKTIDVFVGGVDPEYVSEEQFDNENFPSAE